MMCAFSLPSLLVLPSGWQEKLLEDRILSRVTATIIELSRSWRADDDRSTSVMWAAILESAQIKFPNLLESWADFFGVSIQRWRGRAPIVCSWSNHCWAESRGAHSLGLHPERPLRWLSMSQVLRVWEAFGFSCCRQWRVIKDNTSIESIKEVV